MRPITRCASFLALVAFTVSPAFAGVPNPVNWTIPSHVTLVGLGPAGPDSAVGHVTCVIRDLANNPMPGSVVTLDFSACTDIAIADDQRDPRLFADCSARCVSAVTDVNGIARFTVIGAGTAGPIHPPSALRVYADGYYAGSPSVAVFERDGAGGLTLADLAFWTVDLFSATNPERSDLNGSLYVDIADLSVWAAAYFNGNNSLPTGPYCP